MSSHDNDELKFIIKGEVDPSVAKAVADARKQFESTNKDLFVRASSSGIDVGAEIFKRQQQKIRDEINKAAGGPQNFLQSLKAMQKDNRMSGQNAFERSFGSGQNMVNTLADMAGVGVPAMVAAVGAKMLNEMSQKVSDVVTKFREGKMEAREMGKELLKSFPIVGDIASFGDNLHEIITGEKYKAAQREKLWASILDVQGLGDSSRSKLIDVRRAGVMRDSAMARELAGFGLTGASRATFGIESDRAATSDKLRAALGVALAERIDDPALRKARDARDAFNNGPLGNELRELEAGKFDWSSLAGPVALQKQSAADRIKELRENRDMLQREVDDLEGSTDATYRAKKTQLEKDIAKNDRMAAMKQQQLREDLEKSGGEKLIEIKTSVAARSLQAMGKFGEAEAVMLRQNFQKNMGAVAQNLQGELDANTGNPVAQAMAVMRAGAQMGGLQQGFKLDSDAIKFNETMRVRGRDTSLLGAGGSLADSVAAMGGINPRLRQSQYALDMLVRKRGNEDLYSQLALAGADAGMLTNLRDLNEKIFAESKSPEAMARALFPEGPMRHASESMGTLADLQRAGDVQRQTKEVNSDKIADLQQKAVDLLGKLVTSAEKSQTAGNLFSRPGN